MKETHHVLVVDTIPAEGENWPTKSYAAAGGVVVSAGRVLLMRRESEVRLPKGHIEPGEDAASCAVREVREETGLLAPRIVSFLGTIENRFPYNGIRYERQEHWFAMQTDDESRGSGESQWAPFWLPVLEAQTALTFESERAVIRWLIERQVEIANF